MTALNIHEAIYKKLNYFITENKIPHIIFHGPSGRGKRSIINNFINTIYHNDKQKITQGHIIQHQAIVIVMSSTLLCGESHSHQDSGRCKCNLVN